MFKKLKSLFIVEEESSNGPVKKEAFDSKKAEKQNAADIQFESSSTTVSKKGVDKFVNLLLKALDEAGQDGFDYLEFKDSIKSLEQINMDEETKYKSALAMAKSMGAKGSSLQASAKYYLDVLAKEKQKINNAYTQKITKDKEESANQIQQVNQSITQKSAQLKKLEEELKKHKLELEKLEKGKINSEKKANTIKSEFDKAFQLINGQIAKDLKNLEKYLK